MRKKSLSIEKTCALCGRKYLVPEYKASKSKYCSVHCKNKSNIKKRNAKISDEEFRFLIKKFDEKIKKILYKRLFSCECFNEKYQDCLIALWLSALRKKEDGLSIENIPEGYIMKTIVFSIKNNRIDAIEKATKECSIHKKHFDNDNDVENDRYLKILPNIEQVLDTKNLLTKIAVDALQDEDIQLTVIRAEERNFQDGFIKILKDYNIPYNVDEFRRRALRGAKKLYSRYSNEVLECLEITEKELTFKPDYNVLASPRTCLICGKVFTPSMRDETNRIKLCSKECRAAYKRKKAMTYKKLAAG